MSAKSPLTLVIVFGRQRAESCADQEAHVGIVEFGEDRLAVRTRVQGKRHPYGRHRLKPLRLGHLVDERRGVATEHGEIDGLLELVRQPHKLAVDMGKDPAAAGVGQLQQAGAEAEAGRRRHRDDEVLLLERFHEAVHRRAGQTDLRGEFRERLTLRGGGERSQDGRGAAMT